MNNTPPKYDEDINWKKYLDSLLQEQIKTTDAIENLPYELNINLTSTQPNQIYNNTNPNMEKSILKSIDKINEQNIDESTNESTDEYTNEINEQNKKIVQSIFKLTASIFKTYDDLEETNNELLNEYKTSIKSIPKYVIQTGQFLIDGMKEGYQELSGIIASHISEVVGPAIQRAYQESKTIFLTFQRFLIRTWKFFTKKSRNKREETMYDDISTLTSAATSKGSIYTHDITAEGYLDETSKYFKREEKRRLREIHDNKKGKTGLLAKLLFWGMIIFGMFEEEIKVTFKLFRKVFGNPLKILAKPIFKVFEFFTKIGLKILKFFDKILFKSEITKSLTAFGKALESVKIKVLNFKPVKGLISIIKNIRVFFKNIIQNIKNFINATEKVFNTIENYFKIMFKISKRIPVFAKIAFKFEESWANAMKIWESIKSSRIFKTFKWIKDSIGMIISPREMKKFPGLMGSIGKAIDTIFGTAKLFDKIKALFGIVGRFFIRLKIIPYFIGKFIGKFLTPLEMGIRMIIGFMSGKDIVDKIMKAVSQMFYTFTSIPEMIGNAILWLIRKIFGQDLFKGFNFKQIFGPEIIEKLLRGFSDLFGKYIIDPLIWFFTELIPNLFEMVKNWFNRQIDEIKFYLNPLNWFKGKSYEEARQGNRFDEKTGKLLKNAGESREDYNKRVWEWRKTLKTQQPKYKTGGSLMEYQKKEVEIAKNAYNERQKQIKENQKIQAELLKTNKELAEQNQNVSQNIINSTNIINNRKSGDIKEIPNQNENAILSLVSTGALM